MTNRGASRNRKISNNAKLISNISSVALLKAECGALSTEILFEYPGMSCDEDHVNYNFLVTAGEEQRRYDENSEYQPENQPRIKNKILNLKFEILLPIRVHSR